MDRGIGEGAQDGQVVAVVEGGGFYVCNPAIANNCGALAGPSHGVGLENRALADFGGAFFQNPGVEDVFRRDSPYLGGFNTSNSHSLTIHPEELEHIRLSLRVDVDYHTNIAG